MREVLIALVSLVLTFGFANAGYAQEVDWVILLKHYQAFQTPVFRQLPAQTQPLGITHDENREQGSDRPPLNAGRVAGEILAGGALGTLLGSGGALLGVQIAWDEFHDDLHEHGEYVVLVGWATGSLLGSTIGVYAVGNIGDQTGPFSAALGGSIVGTLIGATGFLMAWAVEGDALYPIAVLALACPSVSATIGFNLRRRYKSPTAESETALINIRDGQMSLAVPTVYFRPDTYGSGGLALDLLRVRF